MDDYTKAMRIQELREQRMEVMWGYFVKALGPAGNEHELITARDKVLELDKQIKELQNG